MKAKEFIRLLLILMGHVFCWTVVCAEIGSWVHSVGAEKGAAAGTVIGFIEGAWVTLNMDDPEEQDEQE